MQAIVRRRFLLCLAIAVVAVAALRLRGVAQTANVSRPAFAKRVVTTGLADPFQPPDVSRVSFPRMDPRCLRS